MIIGWGIFIVSWELFSMPKDSDSIWKQSKFPVLTINPPPSPGRWHLRSSVPSVGSPSNHSVSQLTGRPARGRRKQMRRTKRLLQNCYLIPIVRIAYCDGYAADFFTIVLAPHPVLTFVAPHSMNYRLESSMSGDSGCHGMSSTFIFLPTDLGSFLTATAEDKANHDPSDPTKESRPHNDDIQWEYHPSTNREPEVFSFDTYQSILPTVTPPVDPKPWLPFKTREDFEFSEIALDAAMTKAQVDATIDLLHRCIKGKGKFTLSNCDEMCWTLKVASERLPKVRPVLPYVALVIPDHLPCLVPVWKEGYLREIQGPGPHIWRVDAPNLGMGWKHVARSTTYPPLRMGRMQDVKIRWRIIIVGLVLWWAMDCDTVLEDTSMQYLPIFDFNWRSNLQSSLPAGAKLIILIIYTDKTKLSSFGTQKGYPVIARCAKLLVELQNRNGIGGGRVVGWLPIIRS